MESPQHTAQLVYKGDLDKVTLFELTNGNIQSGDMGKAKHLMTYNGNEPQRSKVRSNFDPNPDKADYVSGSRFIRSTQSLNVYSSEIQIYSDRSLLLDTVAINTKSGEVEKISRYVNTKGHVEKIGRTRGVILPNRDTEFEDDEYEFELYKYNETNSITKAVGNILCAKLKFKRDGRSIQPIAANSTSLVRAGQNITAKPLSELEAWNRLENGTVVKSTYVKNDQGLFVQQKLIAERLIDSRLDPYSRNVYTNVGRRVETDQVTGQKSSRRVYRNHLHEDNDGYVSGQQIKHLPYEVAIPETLVIHQPSLKTTNPIDINVVMENPLEYD